MVCRSELRTDVIQGRKNLAAEARTNICVSFQSVYHSARDKVNDPSATQPCNYHKLDQVVHVSHLVDLVASKGQSNNESDGCASGGSKLLLVIV